MMVTINIEETAIRLSDVAVSFKTHNKVKSTIGIDYTDDDIRRTLEWQQLFTYNCFMLKLSSIMPVVTKPKPYLQSEFVDMYCKENDCSQPTASIRINELVTKFKNKK